MLRISNITISFIILLSFLFLNANLVLAQEVDSTVIPAIDSSKVILLNAIHPNTDGPVTETYHQTAGEKLEKSFKVQVLYNSEKPMEGWPVYFSVISTPTKAKGTNIY